MVPMPSPGGAGSSTIAVRAANTVSARSRKSSVVNGTCMEGPPRSGERSVRRAGPTRTTTRACSPVEHRVGRTGAEVVLESPDLVPLGLRAGEDELEVLHEVGPEVHEDDVAGVEVTADDVEPAVVRRAAPKDQRLQPAPADDAARRLVPLAVGRSEERGPGAVDRREVGDLVADLVV